MKENKIEQSIQNSDIKANQSTPDKDEDLQKKKPDGTEPDNNDPTRNDKPPLIISKL